MFATHYAYTCAWIDVGIAAVTGTSARVPTAVYNYSVVTHADDRWMQTVKMVRRQTTSE